MYKFTNTQLFEVIKTYIRTLYQKPRVCSVGYTPVSLTRIEMPPNVNTRLPLSIMVDSYSMKLLMLEITSLMVGETDLSGDTISNEMCTKPNNSTGKTMTTYIEEHCGRVEELETVLDHLMTEVHPEVEPSVEAEAHDGRSGLVEAIAEAAETAAEVPTYRSMYANMQKLKSSDTSAAPNRTNIWTAFTDEEHYGTIITDRTIYNGIDDPPPRQDKSADKIFITNLGVHTMTIWNTLDALYNLFQFHHCDLNPDNIETPGSNLSAKLSGLESITFTLQVDSTALPKPVEVSGIVYAKNMVARIMPIHKISSERTYITKTVTEIANQNIPITISRLQGAATKISQALAVLNESVSTVQYRMSMPGVPESAEVAELKKKGERMTEFQEVWKNLLETLRKEKKEKKKKKQSNDKQHVDQSITRITNNPTPIKPVKALLDEPLAVLDQVADEWFTEYAEHMKFSSEPQSSNGFEKVNLLLNILRKLHPQLRVEFVDIVKKLLDAEEKDRAAAAAAAPDAAAGAGAGTAEEERIISEIRSKESGAQKVLDDGAAMIQKHIRGRLARAEYKKLQKANENQFSIKLISPVPISEEDKGLNKYTIVCTAYAGGKRDEYDITFHGVGGKRPSITRVKKRSYSAPREESHGIEIQYGSEIQTDMDNKKLKELDALFLSLPETETKEEEAEEEEVATVLQKRDRDNMVRNPLLGLSPTGQRVQREAWRAAEEGQRAKEREEEEEDRARTAAQTRKQDIDKFAQNAKHVSVEEAEREARIKERAARELLDDGHITREQYAQM